MQLEILNIKWASKYKSKIAVILEEPSAYNKFQETIISLICIRMPQNLKVVCESIPFKIGGDYLKAALQHGKFEHLKFLIQKMTGKDDPISDAGLIDFFNEKDNQYLF